MDKFLATELHVLNRSSFSGYQFRQKYCSVKDTRQLVTYLSKNNKKMTIPIFWAVLGLHQVPSIQHCSVS